MFLTSPTKAGKPTPEMPNCSVIRHSWVVSLRWGWLITSERAVLPQRLVAYVTQSIGSRHSLLGCYLLPGMSEQWIREAENKWGDLSPWASGRKTRGVVGGTGNPWTEAMPCKSGSWRFQILPSTALNTQDEEELNKFSSTGVCQTPRRPWGREHKKTKICA